MKALLSLFLLSFGAMCYSEDLMTTDGKMFHDVRDAHASAADLKFFHRDGSARVPLSKLPKEWLLRLNVVPDADAEKAAETKRKQDAAAAWKRTQDAKAADFARQQALADMERQRLEREQAQQQQTRDQLQQFLPLHDGNGPIDLMEPPAGVRQTVWLTFVKSDVGKRLVMRQMMEKTVRPSRQETLADEVVLLNVPTGMRKTDWLATVNSEHGLYQRLLKRLNLREMLDDIPVQQQAQLTYTTIPDGVGGYTLRGSDGSSIHMMRFGNGFSGIASDGSTVMIQPDVFGNMQTTVTPKPNR